MQSSRKRRLLVVMASLVSGACLTVILMTCSTNRFATKQETAMPARDITAVMDAHVSELIAIPGVTGVAVGALDNGTPCILVLVEKKTDEISRKIPRFIEGHPTKIFESGEIKPMDGK